MSLVATHYFQWGIVNHTQTCSKCAAFSGISVLIANVLVKSSDVHPIVLLEKGSLAVIWGGTKVGIHVTRKVHGESDIITVFIHLLKETVEFSA